MALWIAAAPDLAVIIGEDGDLLQVFISMFLGVFIVSLVWSLSSDRRSSPPF